MSNPVTIRIIDSDKSAICREKLVMCSKYTVTVEGMTGNGYLVFHDRKVIPNTWPYNPNTIWTAAESEDGSWLGYCALTNGVGNLDLSMERFVNKICKTNFVGTDATVQFSVFKTGEGMLGTGRVLVHVAEPFRTYGQSFITFRGEKGDDGNTYRLVTHTAGAESVDIVDCAINDIGTLSTNVTAYLPSISREEYSRDFIIVCSTGNTTKNITFAVKQGMVLPTFYAGMGQNPFSQMMANSTYRFAFFELRDNVYEVYRERCSAVTQNGGQG